MPDGFRFFRFFLIFVAAFRFNSALLCLEGSDCVIDASCGECSGVGCTRVTSHNLDDNKEVALTCLPYDTRNFHKMQLEAEGCRIIGDRQMCICYSHDYCNSAWSNSLLFPFIMILLFVSGFLY